MNWRDPKKEKPTDGDIIAVLTQHAKEHNPRSCEVIFGEYRSYDDEDGIYDGFADTGDFTGKGLWVVCFPNGFYDKDIPLAWMPASEFPLPEWVPHDSHWRRDD